MTAFDHDVALSFAGAQRDYVRQVAAALRSWGVRLFYDEDFEGDMWGEDLNEYLQRVYSKAARFVVMFVSAEYAASVFPTAERRAAFVGAMHGSSKVLPVRFDETEVPGLNINVVYLDARRHTPAALADKVARKLESEGIAVRKPTASTFSPVPRAAATELFTVIVHDAEGNTVDGAQVALVGSNGNVIRAGASSPGGYTCDVPAQRLLRLWVGHPNHPAMMIEDVHSSADMAVRLGRSSGVGSTVFIGATGYLPTVKGRFAPIVDPGGRTYVYIDNAAANGEPARPFQFELGVPFEVEDADSSVTVVTIVDTTGNGSLVEHQAQHQ